MLHSCKSLMQLVWNKKHGSRWRDLVVPAATINTRVFGKLLLAKTLSTRGNCIIPNITTQLCPPCMFSNFLLWYQSCGYDFGSLNPTVKISKNKFNAKFNASVEHCTVCIGPQMACFAGFLMYNTGWNYLPSYLNLTTVLYCWNASRSCSTHKKCNCSTKVEVYAAKVFSFSQFEFSLL